MKPLTSEWLAKAEADYHSMLWEMKAPRHRNYDAVCFFAQQCVEKYFKARLQEAGRPVPRTHDLEDLLEMCLPMEPSWKNMTSDVAMLTDYAVDFRYPGMAVTDIQAHRAVRKCKALRTRLRTWTG